MVLAPRGPLFEGGDVPERQTTREVDDSKEGAVRAQAHAEYSILDNENAGTYTIFGLRKYSLVLSNYVFNWQRGKQKEEGRRDTFSSPCLEKNLKLGILKKPLF